MSGVHMHNLIQTDVCLSFFSLGKVEYLFSCKQYLYTNQEIGVFFRKAQGHALLAPQF